jgi:hypothetical protein
VSMAQPHAVTNEETGSRWHKYIEAAKSNSIVTPAVLFGVLMVCIVLGFVFRRRRSRGSWTAGKGTRGYVAVPKDEEA